MSALSKTIRTALGLSPAIIAFTSLHALAQSSPSTPIEDIFVTGTKTPVNIKNSLVSGAVFTAEDIEQLQVNDVPSLLQRVSGISLTTSGGRGSVTSLSLRGSNSKDVVILVNGVRTASATTGSTALAQIPIESIAKIEVVKGPSSALYGADAVGGVIQIFTKTGGEGLTGSVAATAGSYDSQDVTGSLAWGAGGFSINSTLSYEEQAGFDRTDDSIATDDDIFRQKSGNINVRYVNNALDTHLDYLITQGKTAFDNTFGDDTGYYGTSSIENISAGISYTINEIFSVKATAGLFTDESETPPFNSDLKTQRESVDVQLNSQLNPNLLLTFGADYYNDNVSGSPGLNFTTREPQFYDEQSRENSGAFIQLQQQTDTSLITFNFRRDKNEAYGNSSTGSLAVAFIVNDYFRIIPSYGTAFSAPSFNQLYFPGFGNPDLLPQESATAQLQLRFNLDDVTASVAVFNTEVNNQIASGPDSQATNIDVAQYDGVEVDVSWRHALGDVTAAFAYIESVDASTGLQLSDKPEIAASLLAVFNLSDTIDTGVEVSGEHGRFDQAFGGSRLQLGGFAIADVFVNATINENLILRAKVNNLFDRSYVTNIANSTANYRNYGIYGELTAKYTF